MASEAVQNGVKSGASRVIKIAARITGSGVSIKPIRNAEQATMEKVRTESFGEGAL